MEILIEIDRGAFVRHAGIVMLLRLNVISTGFPANGIRRASSAIPARVQSQYMPGPGL
jgi:hypothetical protein